jgi:hypothetical protein
LGDAYKKQFDKQKNGDRIMKARRSILGLIGVLVALTLIVPTVGANHNEEILVGADHNAEIDPVWSDAGYNTTRGQTEVLVWNDAGLHTGPGQNDTSTWDDAGLQPWLAQVKTVGWNDVALRTGPTPDNTVGWNDAGTNAGRLWFYSAAKG